MKKQRIKPYKKILYIEDGSVVENNIEELRNSNSEIFVITYRQGAPSPILVDIKNGGKKV